MEQLLTTTAELAIEGNTNRKGMPKPLHLALFVRRFEREVRAPFPPAPVVRALMAPLAAIARKRGHAERYATPGIDIHAAAAAAASLGQREPLVLRRRRPSGDAEPVGDVAVAHQQRGARGRAGAGRRSGPRPGRSVSRNVAITNPCGAASVAMTCAPQGSVRLKNSHLRARLELQRRRPVRDRAREREVLAPPRSTSPRRSVSAQARITSSAPASGVAAGDGTAGRPGRRPSRRARAAASFVVAARSSRRPSSGDGGEEEDGERAKAHPRDYARRGRADARLERGGRDRAYPLRMAATRVHGQFLAAEVGELAGVLGHHDRPVGPLGLHPLVGLRRRAARLRRRGHRRGDDRRRAARPRRLARRRAPRDRPPRRRSTASGR